MLVIEPVPGEFSVCKPREFSGAELAAEGIGLFAISTYDTDYILTKAKDFERALEALERRGCRIDRPD